MSSAKKSSRKNPKSAPKAATSAASQTSAKSASTTASASTKFASIPAKSVSVSAPNKHVAPVLPKIDALYQLPASVEIPRIAVTEVAPTVEETRFPAKAAVGEVFPVTATVFIDGHAAFGADAVLLRPRPAASSTSSAAGSTSSAGSASFAAGSISSVAGSANLTGSTGSAGSTSSSDPAGYDIYAPLPAADPAAWEVIDRARLTEVGQGLNHFRAELQVPFDAAPGGYAFAVETWVDPYRTWAHEAQVKIPANLDVELMLEEGARLLERAINSQPLQPGTSVLPATSGATHETTEPACEPSVSSKTAGATHETAAPATAEPATGSAKSSAVNPTNPASATNAANPATGLEFPGLSAADQEILRGAIVALRETNRDPQLRLQAATNPLVADILRQTPLRDLATRSRLYPLRVDRERSLAGAWYEIFPRSVGAYRDRQGKIVPGNLRTAAEILPDVAADGFDVLYLTPVHPIGVTHRKGRNAALTAGPDDPGSPWAIGNAAGGHEAIAPELGTMADFDALVAKARGLGLEIALDFALQCAPDHPWVAEHPEWFTARADGTIAYAENPPKKYQDIYPLNFDNDPEGLYRAIREVIEFWIAHGVTIFRMDNPHTKPVRFWQRLAADLRLNHPEVVMLAEAFTKPAMMRGLAKAGFHLSYTYFTWRNTKAEITDYLNELAYDTAHVLRPALFPMTPDILTDYMTVGAPAFKIRAVLAALAGPTWGILGGGIYEAAEHVQRPGVEEVIDNPKYEIKLYDWAKRDTLGIASLNRRLNQIRQAHPALLQLRNIKFHATSNDNLLAFSKHLDARHSPTGKADTILAVLNLDPHHTQEGWVYLDLPALGLAPREFAAAHHAENRGQKVFQVTDELSGSATYAWALDNFVRLDPAKSVAHVFSFSTLH